MFTYQIPNLVNGVGQQALDYRLPNQAEVCDNFWPSVVEGLTRRPGSRLIEKLSDDMWEPGTFTHVIDRDELEKYLMVIRPNETPEVYNLITGAKAGLFISPVNGTTAWANYVKTSQPSRDLRALTVADSTFILNTTREVEEASTLTRKTGDGTSDYVLFWVRQAAPQGEYKVSIKVDGTTYTATTNAKDIADVDVSKIAQALRTKLVSAIPGLTTARTGRASSSVLLRFDPGEVEEITVEDPIANTGIALCWKEVDTLQKLPAVAPEGFIIRVRGDSQRNQDNYWVNFAGQSGLIGTRGNVMPPISEGSWTETTEPLIPDGMEALTLPVTLKITGLNEAALEVISWSKREVGDTDSAPMPSFVGSKIQSISFFQNRLCLTSKSSVSFSESGEFFNFFPTTILLVPDSDRIDVELSADKSSDIIATVPYLQRLILFTRETQFALYGDPVLTPKSISAFPITRLPYDGAYVPQMIGKFIYFAYNQGDYSRVLEYFLERDGETYDSTDTTSHIPRYIPADLHDFSSSADLETLLALPDNNEGKIYVYKFFWQDDTKVQNAWCKFNFPGVTRVLTAQFIRNVMYLITQRESGMYLESLDLSERPDAEGFPFVPFLDLRINNEELPLSYDEQEDTTTITFDNGWINKDIALVTEDRRYILFHVPSDGIVVVTGDFRETNFWCGIPYESVYTLPPLVLKEVESQAGRVIDHVKSRVVSVEVRASDSGDYQATLERRGYSPHIATGNAPLIGTPHCENVWDLRSSQARFFCGCKPEEVRLILFTQSPLPLSLTSASYSLRMSSFKQQLR